MKLPFIPSDCEQSFHLYYLIMPSPEKQQRLISHLRDCGILAVFHYLPLHLSPMGRRFGGAESSCPVAESASERLVRLPLYNWLTEADQGRVIDAVKSFD